MRILLLSDTHVGARRRALPEAVLQAASTADVILHAGDVTAPEVLDELAALAPLHAVRGNNDVTLDLPERLELELGGCRIAMVHDSGPSEGRDERLGRWFPTADVVVFGHSHLPWHTVTPTERGRPRHAVNPGSPTERRRAPHATYAWLDIAGGAVAAVRHVRVDEPSTGGSS